MRGMIGQAAIQGQMIQCCAKCPVLRGPIAAMAFAIILCDYSNSAHNLPSALAHDTRDKVRQLHNVLLLLVLAGCTTGGDWFQREEPRPEPLTSEAAPQAPAPPPVANRGNLSPAATAAAPADANESAGELMDCVTKSCKINCSPKVAVRFRPKWCARFKEPT